MQGGEGLTCSWHGERLRRAVSKEESSRGSETNSGKIQTTGRLVPFKCNVRPCCISLRLKTKAHRNAPSHNHQLHFNKVPRQFSDILKFKKLSAVRLWFLLQDSLAVLVECRGLLKIVVPYSHTQRF